MRQERSRAKDRMGSASSVTEPRPIGSRPHRSRSRRISVNRGAGIAELRRALAPCMARIDRILSLVADQGANELRLGTDREPKMLAYGATKRLSLPTTSEDMLRDLLGEI